LHARLVTNFYFVEQSSARLPSTQAACGGDAQLF
jgi:hypothetical protein